MRRSSIFLLLGAILLGLLAVLAARMFLVAPSQKAPEAPKAYIVVAAKPLKFGDKITADSVKTSPWQGALPEGAYKSARDAVGDGSRTTLRDVKAGEILLGSAISGEAGRLASSTLLGPNMRAIALPVSETAGAGGFIAPGDRVDVVATRQVDDAGFSSIIVQGARVLAVGQLADTSSTDPIVVKSATVEVTPVDAQKIALAQSIGTIALALRSTGDETQEALRTSTDTDLFGAASRAPAQESAAPAASAPAAPAAPAAAPVQRVSGPSAEVRVVRGTESTSYQVPR
jgi:pilus assembly protein CpaB